MNNLISYMILAALAAGLYVGWNIGSNDAANAMGAPVGGRVITYRRAISIMVLFVVLGAVLEGYKVMETVGGEIATSPGIKNNINGSWFASPENGTVENITVYLYDWDPGESVKCAIYRKSDDSLVGFTEERSEGGTDGWYTFNFPPPKPSVTSTDYYLVIWADADVSVKYDETPDKGIYQYKTYDNYPVQMSPTSWNAKISIYATYATGGDYFGYGDVGGDVASHNPLSQVPLVAIVALIAAGLWVTTATIIGVPVSTSQSIVGAVMGAGILISIFEPGGVAAVVEFGSLGNIGLAWILTPIAAALFAYAAYHLVGPPLRRIGSAVTLSRVLGVLVVATGAFAAYSLGANDVGNATAMVYTVTRGEAIWSPQLIGLFGGIALAVGALTYSRRVMETVGTGITRLDAMTAFAAQFGAASTVWMFTQFGIPVSTSQAIVGGVVGAGLVKGIAAVSSGKLRNIVIAWILTPTVAAGLTFALGWVVLGV